MIENILPPLNPFDKTGEFAGAEIQFTHPPADGRSFRDVEEQQLASLRILVNDRINRNSGDGPAKLIQNLLDNGRLVMMLYASFGFKWMFFGTCPMPNEDKESMVTALKSDARTYDENNSEHWRALLDGEAFLAPGNDNSLVIFYVSRPYRPFSDWPAAGKLRQTRLDKKTLNSEESDIFPEVTSMVSFVVGMTKGLDS